MLTRVVVSLLGLPILLYVVYGAPAWAVSAALSVLSAIGSYEALWSTGFLKGRPRLVAYAILVSAAVPFWVYAGAPAHHAQLVLLVYIIALFAENIASGNTIGLGRLGGGFLLALFVPYFLSAFVHLRGMEGWKFYILFPFIAAFLSDIFALFAGMAFGRHKLAPKLSPKKTVEGAVGGVLGASAGMVVYGLLASPLFGLGGVNLPLMALYGVVGSVISQLGDLSFSCIKREFGIKDYGSILPGHGGILDRFDSVIFCAPLMEVLLYFLPVVK